MQCPSCQNTDSRVLESRAADGGRSVRRRRECLNCEFRFTTYERVETVPITVIKRNGNREIFSRSKLLHGLNRACEKTGLDTSRLESLVEELELKLQQRTGKEVSSTEIGEFVLRISNRSAKWPTSGSHPFTASSEASTTSSRPWKH